MRVCCTVLQYPDATPGCTLPRGRSTGCETSAEACSVSVCCTFGCLLASGLGEQGSQGLGFVVVRLWGTAAKWSTCWVALEEGRVSVQACCSCCRVRERQSWLHSALAPGCVGTAQCRRMQGGACVFWTA